MTPTFAPKRWRLEPSSGCISTRSCSSVSLDMPTRRSNPSRGGFINIESGAELDFAELFSAAGVFLATATALVSVYVVLFDGMLPAIWAVGIATSAGARKHGNGTSVSLPITRAF